MPDQLRKARERLFSRKYLDAGWAEYERAAGSCQERIADQSRMRPPAAEGGVGRCLSDGKAPVSADVTTAKLTTAEVAAAEVAAEGDRG